MKYEKISEFHLSKILGSFNDSYIFYHPASNPVLKKMFLRASKQGIGYGIPDRIFYDGTVLVIFECKGNDLFKAMKDLHFYKEHIEIPDGLNVFFVAFVSETNYKIYDFSFRHVQATLCPETFGLKEADYDRSRLSRDIDDIHNYIRDHTKINNEDKCFFSAIILISLTKPSFREIIKHYTSTEFVYDLLEKNLKDFAIDASSFAFLRSDSNNVHLYNLIQKFLSILENHPSVDLLN
jgi:hypothetical protein